MEGVKPKLLIRGGGASAWATAAAAGALGCEVFLDPGTASPRPPIILNAVTVRILRDLIGDLTELTAKAWVIERRVVGWGPGRPAVVNEPGLVVPSSALTDALERFTRRKMGGGLRTGEASAGLEPDFDWILDCAGGGLQTVWGRRVMLVGGVRFATGAANSASWIDSFPGGWLFWFPVGPGAGIIQVMLPDSTEFPRECIQEALAASSLASQSLWLDDSEVQVYRAAPGFRTHFREARAVAVGSGAARLDPLCGDGTGFSLRTALLAAAVADHCRHAPTAEAPWRHYCSRVAAATAHHLRACDRFYSMAESGDTWSRELELGRQGLAMLETLHPPHSSAYRLVGRRLAHYPVLANDSPGGRP
jgi:hypothetical protein